MNEPRILFVDDEPLIRRMVVRILAKNYQVDEADGVDQALQILQKNAHQFGVLVTDLKMPGRDGMELVREVASEYPLISIVISTGALTLYNLEDLKDEGVVFDVIEKPWDKTLALDVISRAMDSYLEFSD